MKLKDLGTQPISPENPAGTDAHYEPEFEQLQEEIDKLSIVTIGQPGIDWNRVTKLAFTILSEKSKDLLVAAYLGIGLAKTHQFEGMTAGITVLKDLVENFWDNMYPPKKRMRGRLNAISWWQEQLAAYLGAFEPEPLLPEAIAAVQKTLTELDQSLADKTEGASQPLRELTNYIARLPIKETEAPAPQEAPVSPAESELGPSTASQPAQAPQPAAPQAPRAAPPQAATSSLAPPPLQPLGDAKSTEQAAKLLKAGLEQLRGVADFTRKSDPGNFSSYRILRLAVWLPVSVLPPVQDGNTLIPAPDSMLKSSIENLVAGRNFQAALNACEENLPQYRFWLDLNRLAAQALEKMGGSFNDARDAIAAETLLFVKRLSGVENLAFADGTPFADPQTQSWLKTLGFGAAGAAPCSGGGAGAEATVAETLNKAQGLLRDQKFVDAVKTIQDGFSTASAGKDRLLWRVALARFFFLAAKPELSLPFVEQILKDIEIFRLEEWDPALALQGLAAAYEVLDANVPTKDQAGQTLARIVRVSPAEAVRIAGIK